MKLTLPYLMRQRDRQGRWVWYVRRKGPRRLRLEGEPGSPQFLAAYQAAIGTWLAAKPARRTWRWLCTAYFASPEFGELSEYTRRMRRSMLETTWAEPIMPDDERLMGDVPLEHFGSKAVRALRDRKKDKPEGANHRVKSISAVFRWALEAEHVTGSNPARDVPLLRGKPGGYHTWTLAEVQQYARRHPLGTRAHLALAVLLFTGVRRGDAVMLGHPNVKDGWICWTEAKGRERHPKERAIPMLPELQTVLAETTLTGRDTWLVTQYGKPFTCGGFGNWFRDRCNESGLPHCSAHGLRKAGATIAAENGATDRQLMAIFGWETVTQVTRYTRKADQRRLAGEAMRLVVSAPRVPHSDLSD